MPTAAQNQKEILAECCSRHARAGFTKDMMSRIERIDEENLDIIHCDIDPDISLQNISISVQSPATISNSPTIISL